MKCEYCGYDGSHWEPIRHTFEPTNATPSQTDPAIEYIRSLDEAGKEAERARLSVYGFTFPGIGAQQGHNA